MKKQLVVSVIAPVFFLVLTVVGSRRTVQVANSGTVSNQTGEQAARITTQHSFLRALVAARVPGGLVWMEKCSGEEPAFRQEGGMLPLHDTLELLTKMDPRYKWQIDRGVVNLLPSAGEPDLLNIRIRQYKISADLNEVLKQLLARPEVKQQAARLGLKRTTMSLLVGPSRFYGRPSRISVDVRSVTLRQALNALVRAHARAVWQYRESRCSGINEFSIDFLAQ